MYRILRYTAAFIHRVREHADQPRFLRFTVDGQALFSKRLAVYLHAGVPILEALMILEKDADRRGQALVIRTVSESVMHGQSLSRGFEPFRRQVGGLFISLIRVGESSGTLRETLLYLAAGLKRRKILRRKIVGALLYPLIVVIATLLISAFLALYAFPKIVPLFRGFHAALPVSTRILIFISDSVAANGLSILFTLIILAFVVWRLLELPYIARERDRLVLRLPFLGSLFRSYAVASLSQTLATLLGSGVSLLPALKLAAQTSSNRLYQEALEAAVTRVTSGTRLSSALDGDRRCFPSMFVQMVRTGESTGTLSSSLFALSEQYEDELDEMSSRMTSLIEPVLMVSMGLMVGFVALAIITPVYRITQDMSI